MFCMLDSGFILENVITYFSDFSEETISFFKSYRFISGRHKLNKPSLKS